MSDFYNNISRRFGDTRSSGRASELMNSIKVSILITSSKQ